MLDTSIGVVSATKAVWSTSGAVQNLTACSALFGRSHAEHSPLLQPLHKAPLTATDRNGRVNVCELMFSIGSVVFHRVNGCSHHESMSFQATVRAAAQARQRIAISTQLLIRPTTAVLLPKLTPSGRPSHSRCAFTLCRNRNVKWLLAHRVLFVIFFFVALSSFCQTVWHSSLLSFIS